MNSPRVKKAIAEAMQVIESMSDEELLQELESREDDDLTEIGNVIFSQGVDDE